MYKFKYLSKNVLVLGLIVSLLASSIPAAMAGGSYAGANGQSYHNDDFWNEDFEVTSSTSDGYASFCWSTPTTYYEGYAVYTTEGSFVGGLGNYSPVYIGKAISCYKYPSKLDNGTKVSAYVYPYIELESGARKFIQPGSSTSVYVKAASETKNPLSLSVQSWKNGFPNISWNAYNGSFDAYLVTVKQGSNWNTGKAVIYHYPSKTDTSLQLGVSLEKGQKYMVQVAPYNSQNGSANVITGTESNVLTVQTDADVETETASKMNLWVQGWDANGVMPTIAWNKFTDASFDAYLVTVKQGDNWNNGKAVVYYYPSKTDTTLELLTALKKDQKYMVQVAPYNSKNGLAYVIKGTESNVIKFQTGKGKLVDDVIKPTTGDYVTKDGVSLSEASFTGSKTVLSASTKSSNGKAYFHWSKPGKYFTGYALYLTEGDFEGGLDNYEPVYISRSRTTYMYPKTFKQDTKVTAYIYPYIELKNGAKKFIQNGSQDSVVVKVKGNTDKTNLATPVIKYPKADAVYTNFPRKAFLSWSKVNHASTYEIEVACDVCSSTTTKWLNPTTYTTSKIYFITPALAGDNEFRFRVRAVAANGKTSEWSAYKYFSYDTSK